jgi:predicted TIM-barrel fold metal-dependent hydrolase
MNRRQYLALTAAGIPATAAAGQSQNQAPPAAGMTPDKLLLKDYRPRSIFKIPTSDIKKAKYPIVDVHCHGARPIEQLDQWVKTMDEVGVEKAVIFLSAVTGEAFAEARKPYLKYGNRFELWCHFDMAGSAAPGFTKNAIKALDDCHRLGAKGVGEVSDKGRGIRSRGRTPRGSTAPPPPSGLHPDDPRMDGLWERCAQLGMPVNIHVSDPIWAYEPMDATNDGLMNGYTWRIDDTQPGVLGHNGLIESLERTVQKHRKTVFIACHLANLDYDLTRLGQLFERHPNLYADISARFAEVAPIPRFAAQFLERYSDRVLYGTDMPYNQRIFNTTFRILESRDEHFYEKDLYFNFDYHWPLHGLGLSDTALKKIYRENALRAFAQARA